MMSAVMCGGEVKFICQDNFTAVDALGSLLADGIIPQSAVIVIKRVRVNIQEFVEE